MLAAHGEGGKGERDADWRVNSGNLKLRRYIDEIVTAEIRKYGFYYVSENVCNRNIKTHHPKQFC